MMKKNTPYIVIEHIFPAPLEQVFALLSQHSTYNRAFAPIQVVRSHDSLDVDRPDGVGSIRRLGYGPIKPLQEQITLLEVNRCIEYKIIHNPLVKYHLGRIDFEAVDNNSTKVIYRIDLQLRVPFLSKIVLAQLNQAIKLGFSKLSRSFK